MPAEMSRRTALLAATGLALTACSTRPDASTGITLRFASWVPHVREVVDLWNATHDDVRVSHQPIASNDRTKIQTAISAGAGPDVTQVSQYQVPDYAINGWAAPIGRYLDRGTEARFTPSAWPSVAFGGQVWGVPQDIGPLVLYYRTDLFTQHGLKVPTTWPEFRATAESVRRIDPSAYLTSFPTNDQTWWQGMLWQAGVPWSGIEGQSWRLAIDTPAARTVADYWQSLLTDQLLVPLQGQSPPFWNAVQRGQIWAAPHASWLGALLAGNAQEQAGRWAVAPIPTWPGSTATGDTGGGASIVTTSSRYPAEAARFALWLNTDLAALKILTDKGGILPVCTAGLDQAAAGPGEEFFGGQQVDKVYADAAKRLPSTWSYGPGQTQTYTEFNDGFASVLAGRTTMAALLGTVQESTAAQLRAKGLSVVGA